MSLSGLYVALIGPGDAGEDLTQVAEEAGFLAGDGGAVIVTGGLGGVMEAACRGAKRAGGLTVGLLPGFSKREANPYVDVAIPTGMGEGRNAVIVRTADCVIAVGKGYGTLAEIAFALREGKPVAGISTWDVAPEGEEERGVTRASSAAEAISILKAALPSR